MKPVEISPQGVAALPKEDMRMPRINSLLGRAVCAAVCVSLVSVASVHAAIYSTRGEGWTFGWGKLISPAVPGYPGTVDVVVVKFDLNASAPEFDRLELQVLDTTGRALSPILGAGIVGDGGVAPTSVLMEWSDYSNMYNGALFEFNSPHLFASDVLQTVYVTCRPNPTMLQWRFFEPGQDFTGWYSVPLAEIPEPATFSLLAFGLALIRRKQR